MHLRSKKQLLLVGGIARRATLERAGSITPVAVFQSGSTDPCFSVDTPMGAANSFLVGMALLVAHSTIIAQPGHCSADMVHAETSRSSDIPSPHKGEVPSRSPDDQANHTDGATTNETGARTITVDIGTMGTSRAAFHAAVQASKHKADEDKIKRPPHFNQRLYPDTDATASHSKIGSSGERTASNIARKCESSAIQ